MTAKEARARYAYVAAALTQGASHRELVSACAARYRMSPSSVERVKRRVYAAWAEDDTEDRSVRRIQARRRLLALIRTATASGNHRTVIPAEALLARIDGLFANERVEVQVNGVDSRTLAIARVIEGLSIDEQSDWLAEHQQKEESVRAVGR